MKIDELEIENDFFRFDSSFYELVKATPLEPRLISFSKSVCDLIGLDYSECEKKEFIDFLNGKKLLKNSTPYATVYAGHQFGHFVPQLGDGRAINLGLLNGYHLQTKGSGVTRYSRQGDGRAVLRSSIREYLLSEAMQGLNIPTTRALAIISSKTEVSRDWKLEPCAIDYGPYAFMDYFEHNYICNIIYRL